MNEEPIDTENKESKKLKDTKIILKRSVIAILLVGVGVITWFLTFPDFKSEFLIILILYPIGIGIAIIIQTFRLHKEYNDKTGVNVNPKLVTQKTFDLLPGIVRFFLLLTLCWLLYRLPEASEVPTTLITALVIALAYYGLDPQQFLPIPLLKRTEDVEDPTNESLLKNITTLYDFLKGFQDFINNQFVNFEATLEVVTKNTAESYKEVRRHLNGVITGIEKYVPPDNFGSIFDKLSFILISLVLSWLVVSFPIEGNNSDTLVLQVIAGSTVALFGIIGGVLARQTFFINISRTTDYQKIRKEALTALLKIREDLDKSQGNIMGVLDALKVNVKRSHTNFNTQMKNFWEDNFLSNFAPDVSALVVITIVTGTILSLLGFFNSIPFLVINDIQAQAILLWFIAYYFATKKNRIKPENTETIKTIMSEPECNTANNKPT